MSESESESDQKKSKRKRKRNYKCRKKSKPVIICQSNPKVPNEPCVSVEKRNKSAQPSRARRLNVKQIDMFNLTNVRYNIHATIEKKKKNAERGMGSYGPYGPYGPYGREGRWRFKRAWFDGNVQFGRGVL